MTNAPAQAPIPPQRVMSQLLFGKQLTASLSALARLGVADHMGDTAISAEELAGKVGAHAPSLYRVMRMLASVGVFTEEPGRQIRADTARRRCSRPTCRAPCATWP